jgi:ketosteroid isomerase-like protein
MRTVLAMIIGLHCLLWPTAVIAQSSDLEQLQAAYEGLNQARTSRDADALAAAVDDRALFFEKSGLLDQDTEEEGKSSFREGLREAFGQIERFESRATNTRYRVFGSTGIAWADFDIAVHKGGRRKDARVRSVHVFTKSGDRWLVVAAFRYPRE